MKVSKKELRQMYRKLRAELLPEQRNRESVEACERVISMEVYQRTDAILTYLSYGSELQTQTLINQALKDGKILAAPRINGNEMVFFQIVPDTRYEKNSYGIPEPVSGVEISPEMYEKSLLILPGLCYDDRNGRIGYGGGFYDRYVSAHRKGSNMKILALALSCQYYEGEIPMESHDISPDLVVYPKKCRQSEKCGEIYESRTAENI